MPLRITVLSYTFIFLFFKICASEPETTTTPADLTKLDYNTWCKFQPNSFDCTQKGGKQRYYYDLKLQDCKPFMFGFCPTSFNNFETLSSCWTTCRDAGQFKLEMNQSLNIACRLQPDFGNCQSYFPMWYFDINERVCKGFSYSGCGGNQNRFYTSQLCTATCPKITGF